MLTLIEPDRLHHYIVVSLLTGARTEKLRALRWDHVHLDGMPKARSPISAIHGGLAIRSPRWRHQDPQVAPHARAASPVHRGATQAACWCR